MPMLRVTPPTLTRTTPTRRACEAALRFGLDLDAPRPVSKREIELDLRPGRVTLVSGPSGAGKTTLVREIQREAQRAGVGVISPRATIRSSRACVDIAGRDLREALRNLASAGLSDARVFVSRPDELSAGQRERLRLASALRRVSRAPGAVLLVLDDFGAHLDATTASNVGALVSRLAGAREHLHVLVSTTHEHLCQDVRPAQRVHVHMHGTPSVSRWEPTLQSEEADRFGVFVAGRAELEALHPHHYRSAMPATLVRVLGAADSRTGELVGVLGVSMPTLNASWRARVWPGLAGDADRAEAARRLNREVRTISRVVVDPRYRGLGVASSLVRAYLADPLTQRTESLASMGALSGFFERGGMRRVDVAMAVRHRQLLGFLAAHKVDAWRLATPGAAYTRAVRHAGREALDTALRRWKHASRATRTKEAATTRELFELAATSIVVHPVAFVAG